MITAWCGLPILVNMGSMGAMKTTIDIHDELLRRAKRHARLTGQPLRAVVEEGLRLALEAGARRNHYKLPDKSVGTPGGPFPLDSYTWDELRDIIYNDRPE